jgi:5-methyltetrahydropteroyltriglutamate--homocysteine methyltransferase
MSCYACKEDTKRFVDIFNRTVGPIVGKCRLSTHLCFGNFKGRPVGYRRIEPMLPDFLDLKVAEIHIEMANREFAEVEKLAAFAEKMDVAVGIVDVKNYYIETVDDIIERITLCLKYVPANKLSVAPDCGLSQTARWASRQKMKNMVAGKNETEIILIHNEHSFRHCKKMRHSSKTFTGQITRVKVSVCGGSVKVDFS